MKKIILFLALAFATTFVQAKNAPVSGEWLLTKVDEQDNTKEVYMPVSFHANSDFSIMDMKMGSWQYDKKQKTVNITSNRFKKMSGENQVLKCNKEEMILKNKNNGAKMYFLRLDKAKIEAANKASGFTGTWKMGSDDPSDLRYITFSEPNQFQYVEKEPGTLSRSSGTWIYNRKKHSLIIIMMGHAEGFRGKNIVLSIDEKGFAIENHGKTIKAVKAKTAGKIEHLTFTEKDFFDSDGNFKYEADENKLPWLDTEAMIDFLKNIHELSYNYASLIKDAHVFQNQRLTANVQTVPEGEKACIDFIFYGYDKKHLPDDTELPPNCITPDDAYNKLFPAKDMDYRVAGKEQITTPAGTFQCTVVEALGDAEQKYKMWMINDKPGIYAKIIEEKPDKNFGYYHVYALQNIK